ncbi:MAG: MFS transporter, partial [Oscillospiraceae bacterium]|nr:MFS transporter [Oscillospiraceae bacterium]
MKLLKDYTREEKSWMFYDWANSAYSVIIVTILPIFFDTVADFTSDAVSSMSTWGYATSIAMAIVALAAPVLGAFGDFAGLRKKLFGAFLALGCITCLMLSATPMTGFAESTAKAEAVADIILLLYI